MRLNACHNRPPFRDWIDVQDGWTRDGRRRMKSIPVPMTKDCRAEMTAACGDCKHLKPTTATQQGAELCKPANTA